MNSAAGKKEHCDQGSGPVESERASGDHAQLVLEAFDEAVGEPCLHVRDDPLEVPPDRPRYADEWFQPRAGAQASQSTSALRARAGWRYSASPDIFVGAPGMVCGMSDTR